MLGVILVLLGVLLSGLSLFGGSFLPNWGAVQSTVTGAMGLLLLVGGLLAWLIAQFYIKPSANLAYVMTGLGGRKVMIDRGGFFFPILQRNVAVSLETMKLEVERKGPDALITKDNLRLDVKAEFYIKVEPKEDSVVNASRSLGEKSVTPQAVSSLVFEKLVSALRSVAATQDLVEIHSQRDQFAISVQQLVRSDLEPNGLTLESVTISSLDQTSQELLSDTNIFDAQGKRKITEITQSALVERNRLEQEAKRAITVKNVETRKEILELERAQAEAEANQQAEVAKVTTAKQREADTYRIEQERLTREAEIAREQAVQAAAIERDKQILLREQEKQSTAIERDRALLLKEQEKQTTDVEREKAVSLAERDKQIAITEAERRRADAERQNLEAQAEREKASQQVITVQQLAQAEREAQTKLITAKQAIEQDRIKRQTEAEVAAFAEVRKAEATKQSALLEAEAAITRARAEAEAQELIAKGQTANKMVDVDVEREKVNVEQAKVEVERQALENKQTFSAAALEFELQKLKTEALRDVQSELARSIGQFMSKGNMNIYGDPTTLAKMTEQYAQGLGVGQFMDGISAGSNGKSDELLQQLLSLVKNATSKDIAPDKNGGTKA
ncbi:MAG: SPFH domain-containing protein [Meiothermus sp.]|nr:SPFH domain-containing protein [Meiothermus sp.]